MRWLAIILLAVVNPACSQFIGISPPVSSQTFASETITWNYADLRLLDPVDAASPEHDLLAVYLRHSPNSQIRLDFLDLQLHNQPDVYLALDYSPGGTRRLPLPTTTELDWDALLYIPFSAPIQAMDTHQNPIPNLTIRVVRDPWMDSLEISFDAAALYPSPGAAAPPEISVQVFIAPPGASSFADASLPVSSFTTPPEPARVLLAFWNTFPAYTPAQGLRRWDGAHTGPLGGRHGLSNLLRTLSTRNLTLALIDLKTPAWLSALDYAGDLSLLDELARRGQLILPEAYPPDGSAPMANYSRHVADRFRLPSSSFAYAQTVGVLPSNSSLCFLPANLPSPLTALQRWGDYTLLPLPFNQTSQPALQPDLNGLSMEARRWMVASALSASLTNPAPLLVLGGNLTQSTWGNPQIARAAFDYITGHPWMQPLDSHGLLSAKTVSASSLPPLYETMALPATSSAVPGVDLLSDPPSPASPLLEAAAQAHLALAPPSMPANPAYQALIDIYQPQVQLLLDAARWADNPQPQASCSSDANHDGQPECVLASRSLYAVFDPAHAALLYLFIHSGSTAHQAIAPTSQLTFGHSDPATWDAQRGLQADPQVIPGAFADADPVAYLVEISADQIAFRHPQGGQIKTFHLLPDGLRVEYQTSNPVKVTLPLVLDPWLRFYPTWGSDYQGNNLPDGYLWRAASGAQVEVRTSGQLQAYAFNDTQASMKQVENPNQEFPPGHYLPFPLALVEISALGDFWVEMKINFPQVLEPAGS